MTRRATDGWRVPGGTVPAVWYRRRRFLRAAADFRPLLVREYVDLLSRAQAAAEAIRSTRPWEQYIRWDSIEAWVDGLYAMARISGTDRPVDSGQHVPPMDAVRKFHDALTAWADRWHLTAVLGSGTYSDSWVLEAAAEALCNHVGDDSPPLPGASFEWSAPLPPPSEDERIACIVDLEAVDPLLQEAAKRSARLRLSTLGFRFDVRPWGGDEAPERWLKRNLENVESVLRAHVTRRLQEVDRRGLEAIPRLRSKGWKYVARAARWQVGEEAWEDFLSREGILEREWHGVRREMLRVFDTIGVEPRPGIRYAPPTTGI